MSRRAKKPDAPEGVIQLVTFVTGHWKMLATIASSIAVVWYFGAWVWEARDIMITKPEVVKIAAQLAEQIAENKAGVDYFTTARIANLNQQIGVLKDKERKGRITGAELRELQNMEAEVKALTERQQVRPAQRK